MKRTIVLFTCILLIMILCVSTCMAYASEIQTDQENTMEQESDVISTGFIGIVYDTQFGNVYLDLSIDEFIDLGFHYGDSVTVEFDNGFVLYNIPFYDGYFTDIGDPLICAYPGYPYPMIAFNFGTPMWEASGAQEDTKVCVTVTGEQEYILPELLLSMHYLDEKREGQSDESFANFRLISGGNIKPGMFYRSASPCDNVHNRSETTDRLMADAGIKTVLNLAESQEELTDLLDEYQEWNSNYARMAENGDVILMDLSSNYMTDIFAEKLGQGLLEMTKHEGPVLIHCQEGKDRTGFVCILLEMLAGSSYEEIEADYLKTYEEYFELDKETFPDAYNFYVEMRLLPIISFITGPMTDYVSGAEDYLKFCGLTDEEIQEIKDYVNQ